MNFLHRGRPVFSRTGAPLEPVPEPVAQGTGLPVAAPAPADGTDALRAAEGLAALRAIALRQAERLRVEAVGCQTFIDGKPADQLWVAGELRRLEDLADLTGEHGPWEAAKRMWAPVPRPPTTSSTTYWANLRGQR